MSLHQSTDFKFKYMLGKSPGLVIAKNGSVLDMSVRSDFTPEEWDLLRRTFLEAGAAMMALHEGGLIRESLAVFRALDDAEETFEGDELIAALLQVQAEDNQEESVEPGSDTTQEVESPQDNSPTYEENKAAMLEMCRKSVALLQEKATPEQVRDYQEVVMDVAERVASATKTGSFLGIGGKRIDDKEAALLDEIREALGTSGE
jgi:hypothetical protein